MVCRTAQRRARQTSVARQLPRPSRGSTSRGSHRRAHASSDSRRSSEDRETERKNEERRQEIAKILSLVDQKQQVDRFLKLIEDSSSPLKTAPKVSLLFPSRPDVTFAV